MTQIMYPNTWQIGLSFHVFPELTNAPDGTPGQLVPEHRIGPAALFPVSTNGADLML